MSTYMICDGFSDAVTSGISDIGEARRVGQRLADRLRATLYLSGPDIEEEIEPASTARLRETSRRPSVCCQADQALDIELELTVGERVGHLAITLAPRPGDPLFPSLRSAGPIGDTLDAWLSGSGLLEQLGEADQRTIVGELSCWCADDRSEIDVDLEARS